MRRRPEDGPEKRPVAIDPFRGPAPELPGRSSPKQVLRMNDPPEHDA